MRRCTNAPRSRIFRRSFLAMTSPRTNKGQATCPILRHSVHNELNCEELLGIERVDVRRTIEASVVMADLTVGLGAKRRCDNVIARYIRPVINAATHARRQHADDPTRRHNLCSQVGGSLT